jgi:hypothetical protein
MKKVIVRSKVSPADFALKFFVKTQKSFGIFFKANAF